MQDSRSWTRSSPAPAGSEAEFVAQRQARIDARIDAKQGRSAAGVPTRAVGQPPAQTHANTVQEVIGYKDDRTDAINGHRSKVTEVNGRSS